MNFCSNSKRIGIREEKRRPMYLPVTLTVDNGHEGIFLPQPISVSAGFHKVYFYFFVLRMFTAARLATLGAAAWNFKQILPYSRILKSPWLILHPVLTHVGS